MRVLQYDKIYLSADKQKGLILLSKEVLNEVKNMLLMILLFLAIELLLFFFFGYFDLSVVWGGILGAAVSFINFFLLAVTVEISVKKGKGAAQGAMGTSYMLRLLFIAAAVVEKQKNAFQAVSGRIY